MPSTEDTLIQRIHRELLDHSDEELELELSEDGTDLNALFDEHVEEGSEKAARRVYFSELFRLQGELVKLQSWVVKTVTR
jgi:polyphosphate kinase 2 (PPK2 family)